MYYYCKIFITLFFTAFTICISFFQSRPSGVVAKEVVCCAKGPALNSGEGMDVKLFVFGPTSGCAVPHSKLVDGKCQV